MPRSTRTSLILAALIILLVGGAVAFLMYRKPPRPVGHTASFQIPPSKPAFVRGAENKTKARNPRQDYAWSLDRRLREKGRTCVIESTGPEDLELTISWTKEKLDREHMEKLQVAEGFFTQLRLLKFNHLVMKIDGKQVWDKQL